jgi:hypothetical protein
MVFLFSATLHKFTYIIYQKRDLTKSLPACFLYDYLLSYTDHPLEFYLSSLNEQAILHHQIQKVISYFHYYILPLFVYSFGLAANLQENYFAQDSYNQYCPHILYCSHYHGLNNL